MFYTVLRTADHFSPWKWLGLRFSLFLMSIRSTSQVHSSCNVLRAHDTVIGSGCTLGMVLTVRAVYAGAVNACRIPQHAADGIAQNNAGMTNAAQIPSLDDFARRKRPAVLGGRNGVAGREPDL
jgi:hypothetical protein